MLNNNTKECVAHTLSQDTPNIWDNSWTCKIDTTYKALCYQWMTQRGSDYSQQRMHDLAKGCPSQKQYSLCHLTFGFPQWLYSLWNMWTFLLNNLIGVSQNYNRLILVRATLPWLLCAPILFPWILVRLVTRPIGRPNPLKDESIH